MLFEKIREGRRLIGHKVGLTSKAMQIVLGGRVVGPLEVITRVVFAKKKGYCAR
jgi:hypothetical protein